MYSFRYKDQLVFQYSFTGKFPHNWKKSGCTFESNIISTMNKKDKRFICGHTKFYNSFYWNSFDTGGNTTIASVLHSLQCFFCHSRKETCLPQPRLGIVFMCVYSTETHRSSKLKPHISTFLTQRPLRNRQYRSERVRETNNAQLIPIIPTTARPQVEMLSKAFLQTT